MGHAGGPHLSALPERCGRYVGAEVLPSILQVGMAATGAAQTAGQCQPQLSSLGSQGESLTLAAQWAFPWHIFSETAL